MPRFVASQPARGVRAAPATAVSVPDIIRPVTALRDLKVTLEPVSVRGRVCFLGGAANAYPCRRLRLTDGNCTVSVKSGARDVWTNVQLDSYVELRNVTVHPAWRGVPGQLELHYHADRDATDGKRRRLLHRSSAILLDTPCSIPETEFQMSRASELVVDEAATVELNMQATVVEVGELDASTEGRPRRRIIVSEDDGS
ncbi:unnamed protein product, partial [Symbiodinium sp. CCMP2592]